jgi:hypothetical protein
LEADGVTVVYACDHEPHSRLLASGNGEITGQDLRHAEFVNSADLLIHDAQYTAEEYPAKVGWGHSSVEYAVSVGHFARAKKVALTHHDPLRDDEAIDCVVSSVRTKLRQNSSSLDVFAAYEGQTVEVTSFPRKKGAAKDTISTEGATAVPKNSFHAGTRDEAESAHHLALCLRSYCHSPVSSRGTRLETRSSSSAIKSILV